MNRLSLSKQQLAGHQDEGLTAFHKITKDTAIK